MTKEEIINDLIRENGYTKYLEIGYGHGTNFNAIKCDHKVAVDPEPAVPDHDGCIITTSDKFFKTNEQIFDLIFVDGLHHADQVRKDIINASKHLSKVGMIVLHDMCPTNKEMQEVPRTVKHWTGDCWRAMVGFRKKYPDVLSWVHDHDYGVGVIVPNGRKFAGKFEDTETSYDEFNKDRVTLLGIVND